MKTRPLVRAICVISELSFNTFLYGLQQKKLVFTTRTHRDLSSLKYGKTVNTGTWSFDYCHIFFCIYFTHSQWTLGVCCPILSASTSCEQFGHFTKRERCATALPCTQRVKLASRSLLHVKQASQQQLYNVNRIPAAKIPFSLELQIHLIIWKIIWILWSIYLYQKHR